MTKRFEAYLSGILDTFDSIDLIDDYKRRISAKALYDYFQTFILEVAVHFCRLDRNSLKHYHLKARWDITKSCLGLIEDPTRWDELVYELQNIRSRVEHKDYEFPKKTALLRIRQRGPEFKDWILRVAKQYNKESKGFSLVQKYSLISKWYIGRADWALHLYGDSTPYSVERDYVPSGEEHPYKRLKPLRDNLEARIREIDSTDDLKQDDLDNLIELVRETERLDAKEDVLLQYSICPKCGGKIVDTEREVGGSFDDPMPSAIVYRVGCASCDYEVHSETIEL